MDELAATKAWDCLQAGMFPFRFPGIENVHCFFSTGVYGNISLDSAPNNNQDSVGITARRKRYAELFGFDSWTEMRQVHGDRLLVNPPPTPFDQPSGLEADGCCTDRPGQAMLSKAADCQQILLAHKSGKYVAALHVGWRGNSIDFPESGALAFCEAYKIKPKDVMAVRGPSLGPRAAEFVNFKKEWPEKYQPWFDDESRRMDLWSLTRHQLAAAGIKPKNIYGIDLCTFTNLGLFFSHRAGDTGRQGAVIFMG